LLVKEEPELIHVKAAAAPAEHDGNGCQEIGSTAMPNTVEPRHGQWYAHLNKGGMFKVVAIDPSDGSIEVQTFEGDVEEFEFDDWLELDLAAVAEPDDCSGPFDELEPVGGELPQALLDSLTESSRYSMLIAQLRALAQVDAARELRSAGSTR
jgi:hypothetical protein